MAWRSRHRAASDYKWDPKENNHRMKTAAKPSGGPIAGDATDDTGEADRALANQA